jgi:F-type H+-transporting ATPase subunit epsilon
MRLKVWIPTEVILDEEVTRLKAEAENGWFGVLPRHVDYVTSLVPGVLCFQLGQKETEYLAIDYGVLVKCGPEVCVSTRNAVRGRDPAKLKAEVEEQFRAAHKKEEAARALEAKLEADLVRELLELEHHG